MRAVVGSTVTVMSEPFDGTPVTPAAVVTRADGTTATAPSAAVVGTHVAVTLTAANHLDQLDQLDVTITATVGGAPQVVGFRVDAVGTDYMTLARLRREPGLSDVGRFPDWLLMEHRDGMAEYVERYCRQSFVPQFVIESHWGKGGTCLPAFHSPVSAVRAATIDGEAVDVADIDIIAGTVLHLDAGWTAGKPIVVEVEHGDPFPPAKIVTAMVRAVRRDLLGRGAQAPSDMLWETVDGNTVRYSTPDYDAGRPTGVLELDAVLNGYRAIPGIA
jgi:hypothetical protein